MREILWIYTKLVALLLLTKAMTDLYRLDLTPADGSLGYGTAMHPSLRQHTKMAEELTAFLRQIMNW